MPRLHEPVCWPLGRHGAAVELPRQPDREIADVDHLLDLAQRLGADLADLDADQAGEVSLVLGQQLAEALDQTAADRSRYCPPGQERRMRCLDRRLHVRRRAGSHIEQGLTSHGATRADAVRTWQGAEVGPAPPKGGLGESGEFAGGRNGGMPAETVVIFSLPYTQGGS
jgi:hypothetical protein